MNEEFFTDYYDFFRLYDQLQENKIEPHKPDTHPDIIRLKCGYALDNLRSRIEDGFYNLYQTEGLYSNQYQEVKEEIMEVIDEYDKKVKSYWGGDSFDGWYKLLTNGPRNEKFKRMDSIYTEFFLKVIYSNEILPQLRTKKDLSNMLFGGENPERLYNIIKKEQKSLRTFTQMKFIVSRWSLDDFKNVLPDVSLTNQGLYDLKTNLN